VTAPSEERSVEISQSRPEPASHEIIAKKPSKYLPGWPQLLPSLGPTLCDDLREACESRDHDSITRRFFYWAGGSDDAQVLEVLSIYRSDERLQMSSAAIAAKTASVLTIYIDSHKRYFKQDWHRQTQGVLGKVLQALGEMPGRNYPPFHPKLLSQPRTITLPQKSLGRLQWPELHGVAPADKEAVALGLVRSASQKLFERGEALYRFGQTVLRGNAPPNHVNPADWRRAKSHLTSLANDLRTTAVEEILKLNTAIPAQVWLNAGMPAEFVVDEDMHAFTSSRLAFGCLGPTSTTTMAVKSLFCCGTGWNKTQIEDLPDDPYAYRDDDEAGLGETAFLAAFKNRAGHFVSALLERGFRDTSLSSEQFKIIWGETRGELPESCCAVTVDSNLLEVMDRYREMTQAIREFDIAGQYSQFFFVSLTANGVSRSIRPLQRFSQDRVLSRPGVGYQAVRSSYTAISRRRLGTLEATKHVTSHNDTALLLEHYDDLQLQQELDEAIAFWQNCFQAEILREDPDVALRIELPVGNSEWFEHMSIAGGISASLGIKRRRLSVTHSTYIDFAPSQSSFTELYLLRRAIIGAKKIVGSARWRVQGLPLLALVKALRRYAFATGYGARYASAVRAAYGALGRREIALPRILEI